jgi:hypothetical protein
VEMKWLFPNLRICDYNKLLEYHGKTFVDRIFGAITKFVLRYKLDVRNVIYTKGDVYFAIAEGIENADQPSEWHLLRIKLDASDIPEDVYIVSWSGMKSSYCIRAEYPENFQFSEYSLDEFRKADLRNYIVPWNTKPKKKKQSRCIKLVPRGERCADVGNDAADFVEDDPTGKKMQANLRGKINQMIKWTNKKTIEALLPGVKL